MSRSANKYKIRDKSNRYKRIEKLRLEAKYYTDVAKSHERKIYRQGLGEDSQDGRG